MRSQHEKDRELELWRQHRLTLKRFRQILESQQQRCGCCGTLAPEGQDKDWYWRIDHDAEGRIRGILCETCNTGIEQLGDDLLGVQRAVAYLESHARRRGHPFAQDPPKIDDSPKISAVMERCHELFKLRVPVDQVVIIMKLVPSDVKQIYQRWLREDGAIERGHVFQLVKEPNLRAGCSCGYAAAQDTSLETAIDLVNEHIKSSEVSRSDEWERLKAEETKRREEVARRKEEERRAEVVEDVERRAKGASLKRAEKGFKT